SSFDRLRTSGSVDRLRTIGSAGALRTSGNRGTARGELVEPRAPRPPVSARPGSIELRRARPTSLRQGYGGPPKLQRRRKRRRREGGQPPVRSPGPGRL